MKLATRWGIGIITALAAVSLAAPRSAGAEESKKKKGTVQAQRAGWLFGMYLGEERGHPYPFVVQLDEGSEAKLKGVRQGDEIIRFDGEEVYQLNRLFDRGNSLRPGKEIVFWVRRGVEPIQIRMRVPKDPGAAPTSDRQSLKPKEKDQSSEASADEKKKKEKRKPPVVIKPIPADGAPSQ